MLLSMSTRNFLNSRQNPCQAKIWSETDFLWHSRWGY